MPKVFGWEHLVYLSVFIVVSAAAIVAVKFKVKSEKTVEIVVKSSGAALLALIIWNRFAIADFKDNWLLLIPDSFCGVASFALGICAIFLKKDALPFHYLIYIGFFGGIANVFYPYYVSQGTYFMLPATISGLLHHSLSLLLCIVMVMTGYVKPSLKKYYAFPLGICFTLIFGVFLLDALGVENVGKKGFTTAMNIFTPLAPGTFLTWYVVFPFFAVALYFALFFYEKYFKNRKKPEQPNEEQ